MGMANCTSLIRMHILENLTMAKLKAKEDSSIPMVIFILAIGRMIRRMGTGSTFQEVEAYSKDGG
jgi:hypothetical protein